MNISFKRGGLWKHKFSALLILFLCIAAGIGAFASSADDAPKTKVKKPLDVTSGGLTDRDNSPSVNLDAGIDIVSTNAGGRPSGTPGAATQPLPQFSGINAPIWISANGPAQIFDDLVVEGVLDARVGFVNSGPTGRITKTPPPMPIGPNTPYLVIEPASVTLTPVPVKQYDDVPCVDGAKSPYCYINLDFKFKNIGTGNYNFNVSAKRAMYYLDTYWKQNDEFVKMKHYGNTVNGSLPNGFEIASINSDQTGRTGYAFQSMEFPYAGDYKIEICVNNVHLTDRAPTCADTQFTLRSREAILNVSTAPSNPAGASVLKGATETAAVFALTAGPEMDATVENLILTRSGSATDADVPEINVYVDNNPAPLNIRAVGGKYTIPSLGKILAGSAKTLTVKAKVAQMAGGNATFKFSVANSADVTAKSGINPWGVLSLNDIRGTNVTLNNASGNTFTIYSAQANFNITGDVAFSSLEVNVGTELVATGTPALNLSPDVIPSPATFSFTSRLCYKKIPTTGPDAGIVSNDNPSSGCYRQLDKTYTQAAFAAPSWQASVASRLVDRWIPTDADSGEYVYFFCRDVNNDVTEVTPGFRTCVRGTRAIKIIPTKIIVAAAPAGADSVTYSYPSNFTAANTSQDISAIPFRLRLSNPNTSPLYVKSMTFKIESSASAPLNTIVSSVKATRQAAGLYQLSSFISSSTNPNNVVLSTFGADSHVIGCNPNTATCPGPGYVDYKIAIGLKGTRVRGQTVRISLLGAKYAKDNYTASPTYDASIANLASFVSTISIPQRLFLRTTANAAATSYRQEDTARIVLDSPSDNTNPSVAESVTVTVNSYAAPASSTIVRLNETGPNTHIFQREAELTSYSYSPYSATSPYGIKVTSCDRIKVSYGSGTDIATATVNNTGTCTPPVAMTESIGNPAFASVLGSGVYAPAVGGEPEVFTSGAPEGPASSGQSGFFDRFFANFVQTANAQAAAPAPSVKKDSPVTIFDNLLIRSNGEEPGNLTIKGTLYAEPNILTGSAATSINTGSSMVNGFLNIGGSTGSSKSLRGRKFIAIQISATRIGRYYQIDTAPISDGKVVTATSCASGDILISCKPVFTGKAGDYVNQGSSMNDITCSVYTLLKKSTATVKLQAVCLDPKMDEENPLPASKDGSTITNLNIISKSK